MKKISVLLLSILFSFSVMSQKEVMKPTLVAKAVYFDVSPPLREMIKNPAPADNSWKDGVVKNHIGVPIERNRAQKPGNIADPAVQSFFGSTAAPNSTIVNVDGVSNVDGVIPPDTEGDVGPNHYFQMINLSFSIYNKSGVKLAGPTTNTTIWNGVPGGWSSSNDGDPVVLYDEWADRWLVSQFSLPDYPNGPFAEMVAISQTNDPLGSWYRYIFQFNDMPDYPKIGIWPDGYYMTCNRFTSGAGNYTGTGVAVFERSKMIQGLTNAQMIYFTTTAGQDPYSFLPADADGATQPPAGTNGILGYLSEGFPDKVIFYQLHADWTTPANSTFTNLVSLPVDPFNTNISGIAQKGTSKKLEPINDRIMFRLQYRNFGTHQSMVACHTVDATSSTAGVRWYEFRDTGSGWTVYQQGTYSPDADNRWMGSIAMNGNGDIGLGYSVSGSNTFPSVRYTGRFASDPLGQMTITEESLVAGGGNQTGWEPGNVRWGDYSAMGVDPTDDSFWYTQEYASSSGSDNWKTRIGQFSFAGVFNIGATADPSSICAGESSHLEANAAGGSGTYTYVWSSNPPGFVSTLPDPYVTPDVTTTYYVTVDDGTNQLTDDVLVIVYPAPGVSAGNDTTVCHYVSSVPVDGAANNYGNVSWVSSGDGTFDDPTALSTIYHPGPQDITIGTINLQMTAYSAPPCTSQSSDIMTLLIDPCTGINDDAANTFSMAIVPNPSKGEFSIVMKGINGNTVNIMIHDTRGQVVYSQDVHTSGADVTFNSNPLNLKKGIYFVEVKDGTNRKFEKLIVE